MKSYDEQHAAGDGPEDGATPEAVALHGGEARAEQHPQPDAVTLDGDTRIASPDVTDEDDEGGDVDR